MYFDYFTPHIVVHDIFRVCEWLAWFSMQYGMICVSMYFLGVKKDL